MMMVPSSCKQSSFIIMMIMGMMMMMVTIEGVMGFKEFSVGGHHGWNLPDANDTDFYSNWAAKKRFHVGDSLRFQYQNDSVLVVDKYGYYHCDISKATSTFNDGNTIIKLDQPGLIYLISGTPEHCQSGQRLAVDVMSPHPSPGAVPPESESKQGEAPGLAPRNGGSQLVLVSEVSSFLGVLVATSMFLL